MELKEISLGSNKKCAEVVHVRNPYSFWVRLEDYKNDYKSMLSQIQLDYADDSRNGDEPDSINSRNVVLGSLYCAFNQHLFEWHRCEALGVNKPLDSIHIYYIDLGTTDLIPFRCLKHLRDNYKTIGKYAINCRLSNVKPVDSSPDWSTAANTMFSQLVLNKTCTMTVKRKHDKTYEIDLFVTTTNIAEELIRERYAIPDDNSELALIQKQLNLLVPVQVPSFITKDLEIKLGVDYNVTVPFIMSPYCFYVQLMDDNQFAEFLEFERTMQTYYEDIRLRSEIVLLKKPQLGQMCVAKYAENDQWYRALIKEISDRQKHVRVFFIDYGNEEVIPVDGNLLLLNEQFHAFPPMAIGCCLDGVKPLTDIDVPAATNVADFMYEAMVEKTTANFIRKSSMGDFYMVNILVGGQKLSQLLIEKKYALPNVGGGSPKISAIKNPKSYLKSNLTSPAASNLVAISNGEVRPSGEKKRYPKGELIMDVGKTYEVQVTNVETINEFYVQLAGNHEIERLRKLMSDMKYFYERKQNLPQPMLKVGEACAYCDYEKKAWLRGKIVRIIDRDHCLIMLVDFGVTRYVNKAALKEIYDKFLEEPCNIGRACLNDLDELDDEEIDEKLQIKFKEIVSNQKFLVKVVHTCQIDTTLDANVDRVDVQDMIMTKYSLNLFNEQDESVYKLLVDDINVTMMNSSGDVNAGFKPRMRSKLEETRLDDTVADSRTPVRPNRGRDIIHERSSPFPVHEENLKPKPIVNGHAYIPRQFESAPREREIPASLEAVSPALTQELTIQIGNKPHESKTEPQPIKPQPVIEPIKQTTENEPAQELICYPEFNFSALYSAAPQPVVVNHFESPYNFYVQLSENFDPIDESFGQLQDYCQSMLSQKRTLSRDHINRRNLAIAAKFYDDNIWYRAKITEVISEDSVKIQFVDYGNNQTTPIHECVYLSQDFAKFPVCAIQCGGVAYMNQLEMDVASFENLLINGNQEEPMVWQSTRFIKTSSPERPLVAIDELLRVAGKAYQNFDPNLYHEPITKRIQLQPGQSLDVRFSSMTANFKYIYYNPKSSLAGIEQLEKELAAETNETLVQIDPTKQELKLNQLYIIRHENKLRRASLVAGTSKRMLVFHLIDYGSRAEQTNDSPIYVLMPSYFRHPIYSVHCRLEFADTLEKQLSKDERQKVSRQVQLAQRIRVVDVPSGNLEPFVIELVDESGNVDFMFSQAVVRLVGRGCFEFESQELLRGPEVVNGNTNNKFCFVGQYLLSKPLPTEKKIKDVSEKKFVITSLSLWERFKNFQDSLEAFMKKSPTPECHLLKKGNLLLAKTSSDHFLSKLKEPHRQRIQSSWSRVLVDAVISPAQPSDKSQIKLTYIDYGLRDTVDYIVDQKSGPSMVFVDYKFAEMPLKFKINPAFNYVVKLNRNDIERKLAEAANRNEFFDAPYLVTTLESLHSTLADETFQVDFSPALISSSSSIDTNTVYMADLSINDENLIDYCIRNGLNRIGKQSFPCFITHINSVNDFYVQKSDDTTQNILTSLHANIELKFNTSKLNPLKSIDVGKLCVAPYEKNHYRARINSCGSSRNPEEIPVEVFFIDFGNTEVVKMREIREITPDLVDRVPPSLAYRCSLDGVASSEASEEFLVDVMNRGEMLIKCKSKNESNSKYIIELYDPQTNESLVDMIRKREMSSVNMTTPDEDKAISETTMGDSVDGTYLNETTMNVSRLGGPLAQVYTGANNQPPAKSKPEPNETLPNLSISMKQDKTVNDTWNVTPANQRCYDHLQDTVVNTTAAPPQLERTVNDELYQTVCESPSKLKTDLVILKNCLVSFLHSSEDFFVQMPNFDQRYGQIQPEIDECLDPFDLNESKLCVCQYKTDEMFYRGRVLEWNEEKGETLVLFIDWGNKEWCAIDSTTRLSDTLREIKPLAINCRLKQPVPMDSPAYQQLISLINQDILFDVRIKRADLERYFDIKSLETCGDFKCECELITIPGTGVNGGGVYLTPDTLSLPSIWETINDQQEAQMETNKDRPDPDANFIQRVILNMKTEPMSVLEEAPNRTCSDQANQDKQTRNSHRDDDDQDENGPPKSELGRPIFIQLTSSASPAAGDSVDGQKTTTSNDSSSSNQRKTEITDQLERTPSDPDMCPTNPEAYFYKPDQDLEPTYSNMPELSILSEYKADENFSQLADQSSYYPNPCSKIEITAKNPLNQPTINGARLSSISSLGSKSEAVWDESEALRDEIRDESQSIHEANNVTVPKLADTTKEWVGNGHGSNKPESPEGDDDVFERGDDTKPDNSVIDNTQMHPKNETIPNLGDQDTIWHSEKSRIANEPEKNRVEKRDTKKAKSDETMADEDSQWDVDENVPSGSTQPVKNGDETSILHPKNTTVNVSKFDQSSIWEAKQADKEPEVDQSNMSIVHPDNLTVNMSKYEGEKTWHGSASINESSKNGNHTIESSFAASEHPHNHTVNFSKFGNNSIWEPDTSLMNHPKNKTLSVSQFDKSDQWDAASANKSRDEDEEPSDSEHNTTVIADADYLARTINPNEQKSNESTWSSEQTRDSEPNNNENPEFVEYRRVLVGHCVNVNSIEDFYFRVQDADQQINSIKPNEADLKPCEDLKIGDLYWSRVNGNLCRAQVLNIDDSKEHLNVLHIDYGVSTKVKRNQLFQIDKQSKYIPPLAISCRLHQTKQIDHLISRMNESKRDSNQWLAERFRDLVPPKKLVTLKQVKEFNMTTSEERLHKICVDLFVSNGKENICELLLIDAVNELSRENKCSVRISAPSGETFDCRVIEVNISPKNHLVGLKIQNESVLRKIDAIISSIENMSFVTEISPQACYLAPIPDDLWPKYSSLLKKRMSRVKILDKKKDSSMVRVLFDDFNREEIVAIESLMPINRQLENIQSAVDTMSLYLDDGEKLDGLSENARVELSDIIWNLVGFQRLKAAFVSSQSKHRKSDHMRCVKLTDPNRESLNLGVLVDWCLSLMQTMPHPIKGYLTHLDDDFGHFDFLAEVSHDSSVMRELKKLYRAEVKRGDHEASPLKIGDLCFIDCTQSGSKTNPKKPSGLSNCESLIALNDPSLISMSVNEFGEDPNEPDEAKTDLSRGIVIDISTNKCVLLNVDDGIKQTVNKKRIFECTKLITRLPFMLIKAKLGHEVDEATEKQLKLSRFYGEAISLIVVADQPTENQKTLSQFERRLYKLIKMPAHVNDANSSEKPDKKSSEPVYYKLSYVKSLTHFYIHTSETMKQLREIEDELGIEYQQKKEKPIVVIEKGRVYGYFSGEENKFYRVRVMDSGEAFFIDYGYMRGVNMESMFEVTEWLAQMAPEARCCRLSGFQDRETLSELTNMARANELRSRTQLDLFRQLLDGKYFLASLSSQFVQSNKKILNHIPAQCDNTHPVEIVIHLLKNEEDGHDEYSEMKAILNNSSFFLNEINTVNEFGSGGEKTRNLTDILKRFVGGGEGQTTSGVQNMRRASVPAANEAFTRPLKHSDLFSDSKNIAQVEIANVVSPSEFYVRKPNWEIIFQQLTDQLKRELNKEASGRNIREKDLLQPGLLCAYVNRVDDIYRRAIVVTCNVKNSHLQAKLFLIDTGKYITSNDSNLFYLENEYYFNVEPLCFLCALKLDPAVTLTANLIEKFKSMVSMHKKFRLERAEPNLPSHLLGGFVKYSVEMSPNAFTSPSLNQQLFQLSVTADTTIHEIEPMPQPVNSTFGFREFMLPMNTPIKAQLTNVDSTRLFGVVMSCHTSKRADFIKRFHYWHRDERSSLKLLADKKSDLSAIVGRVCTVHSVMQGQWSRAVVLSCDPASGCAVVYLVDFCKTLSTMIDRLYKLEKPEFLEETVYVARCELEDDQSQREKFSKYVDLLKNYTPTSGPGSPSPAMSTSHIAIESFELTIECKSSQVKCIDYQSESVRNTVFTIRINDLRRVVNPFQGSPHSILAKSRAQKFAQPTGDSFSSMSATMLFGSGAGIANETTIENVENVLSNNSGVINPGGSHEFDRVASYASNPPILTINSDSAAPMSSSNRNDDDNNNGSQQSNTTSNETFSAFTESTRIQNNTAEDTLNDLDNTVVSNLQIAESSASSARKHQHYHKKSRLSSDLDEPPQVIGEDQGNDLIACLNDLEVGGPLVRVILAPGEFNINEFVCYKAELQTNFERLQAAMNTHYEKITKASKSLESDEPPNSLKDNLVDSLTEIKPPSKQLDDPFAHSFKQGDYGAICLNKKWWRCLILEIDGKKAFVECVDDCSNHVIHLSKIEKLMSVFRKMPRYAFKCTLSGWTSAKLIGLDYTRLEEFKELLCEKKQTAQVEILEFKESNFSMIYDVKLLFNGVEFIEHFQKKDLSEQ